jgi:hypothetical protein
MADALQMVTTYGDEEIVSGQAMLSTFQLTGNQIETMTPRMLDMAAAMEKTTGQTANLEDIAKAMGKAMTGTAGALKRYGVSLTKAQEEQYNTSSGAERLKLLMTILDQNFKGVAKSVGQTLTGQLKIAGNAIGEIKEIMGKALAEAISPFISKFTTFAAKDTTRKQITLIGQAAGKLITNILSLFSSFAGAKNANELLAKINTFLIKMDMYLTLIRIGWNVFKTRLVQGSSYFLDSIERWRIRIIQFRKALNPVLVIFRVIRNVVDTIVSSVKTILSLLGKSTGAIGKVKAGVSGVPNKVGAGRQAGTPYVHEAGLYQLHKGEAVIPAHRNKQGTVISLTINNPILLDKKYAEQMGDLIIQKLTKNIKLSAIMP